MYKTKIEFIDGNVCNINYTTLVAKENDTLIIESKDSGIYFINLNETIFISVEKATI